MAKNYWFFMSYARFDRQDHDDYIQKFYKTLCTEVCRRRGLSDVDVGFFDGDSVEPGEVWPDALAEALQNCRVFVPLYSPTYFTKHYCGKEWRVFTDRLDAHVKKAGGARPALILPVLWQPPSRLPKSLPQTVSDVQYVHDDLGEQYSSHGLRQLMKLNKHKDDYEEFVTVFADKLIEAAESCALPPLANLPSIKIIESAFHTSEAAVKPAETSEGQGPRYVQFVFVAGRRDEFQAANLRTNLANYGSEGVDWRPYLPDEDNQVSMFAMEVSLREKLNYEVLPLDANLLSYLEEAERKNKIVAIIVDTWTLRLEKYKTFMREYDRRLFVNCVVLVPWNENDAETKKSRAVLEEKVQEVFPNRFIMKDPSSFLNRIDSPQVFKNELGAILNRARMRIIEKARILNRAESAQVITKPVITGPGGA